MELQQSKAKVITDFTFYTGMYHTNQDKPSRPKLKGEKHVSEPLNMKIRRVDKEYPVAFNRIRSKLHPRVNLPVFKRNRNEKIKVFSVESKDRKHKWQKIKNNFKKIKREQLLFGSRKDSQVVLYKPRLKLNFRESPRRQGGSKPPAESSKPEDSSNHKRYRSVNQREEVRKGINSHHGDYLSHEDPRSVARVGGGNRFELPALSRRSDRKRIKISQRGTKRSLPKCFSIGDEDFWSDQQSEDGLNHTIDVDRR